jgi:hypothetical protein
MNKQPQNDDQTDLISQMQDENPEDMQHTFAQDEETNDVD